MTTGDNNAQGADPYGRLDELTRIKNDFGAEFQRQPTPGQGGGRRKGGNKPMALDQAATNPSPAGTPPRPPGLKLTTPAIITKCLRRDMRRHGRATRRPGPRRQSPKASSGLSGPAAPSNPAAARPSRTGTPLRPTVREVATPGILE